MDANDLMTAIRQHLDAEERRADSIHTLDCELTLTAGFHGPCTCGIPAAVLRQVQANREILQKLWTGLEDYAVNLENVRGDDCGMREFRAELVRALACGLGINP